MELNSYLFLGKHVEAKREKQVQHAPGKNDRAHIPVPSHDTEKAFCPGEHQEKLKAPISTPHFTPFKYFCEVFMSHLFLCILMYYNTQHYSVDCELLICGTEKAAYQTVLIYSR